MGIKPSGDNPIIVPPDNIQSRWGEWEADLDATGQVAGEVHLETWSLAESANTWISQNSEKVQGLLEDSAGMGEDSKTIQQQMRELLDPENENSELWELQDEVNRLESARTDMLERITAINREDLDRREKYVPYTLVARGDRVVSDDYIRVEPDGLRLYITARDDSPMGAWTGEILLQSSYPNGNNVYSPVTEHSEIPTGKAGEPRWLNWPGGGHNLPVINYWVRNAIHGVDDKSTGSYNTGQWTTRDDLTFTAPVDADYSIFYRVTWGAATYTDEYAFRVLRNGTEIMKWGPMWKVGAIWATSPSVRRRAISDNEVPLSEGDVVTFQTYSTAGRASQRLVQSSERKISWLMPATEGNMAEQTWTMTAAGDGSFTEVTGHEDEIQWGGTNSIRFTKAEVTADQEVAVHNPTTGEYVPVAAGTVIDRHMWIRTVEPHPPSVTFTGVI